MEAENYSTINDPSDGFWAEIDSPVTYSGTGGMQANPTTEDFTVYKDFANVGDSPFMEYTVDFLQAGSVYIWARACHTDGYDDSFYMGINEVIYDDPVSYKSDEQEFIDWYWIRFTMGGDTARLEVPSVGVHTVIAYMREPGFKLDKIVLTPDVNYIPTGVGPGETLASGTSIGTPDSDNPKSFSLAQNYPNPFNPSTSIRYDIYKNGEISLTIYNINGIIVKNLISNKTQTSGSYSVDWDGTNNEGVQVTSAVYFYELTQGYEKSTRKMMLVR